MADAASEHAIIAPTAHTRQTAAPPYWWRIAPFPSSRPEWVDGALIHVNEGKPPGRAVFGETAPLEPYLQVRHWFVAEANFSALARANALVSDTNAPQIKLKISDVAAGAAKLDHDVGAPGRRQHVASEK